MFPLSLQSIISNQMRPRRLRGAWFSRHLRYPARRRTGSILSPGTRTGYDSHLTYLLHNRKQLSGLSCVTTFHDGGCSQLTSINYVLTAGRWYGVCVRTWHVANDWSSTLEIVASTHYIEVFTTTATGLYRLLGTSSVSAFEGCLGKNKGNKDGFLGGLIRRAPSLPRPSRLTGQLETQLGI